MEVTGTLAALSGDGPLWCALHSLVGHIGAGRVEVINHPLLQVSLWSCAQGPQFSTSGGRGNSTHGKSEAANRSEPHLSIQQGAQK